MKTGPLYPELMNCDSRIIVCQGGGDAGKTVTIEQVLATKAIREPGVIITIEGEDIPNLRAGALRSFQRYVASDEEIMSYIAYYNKTDRLYTFKGGSIIEFKSFEDEQDARGSERDYLYMNECNTRAYNLFWQLQRKTRKQVFLDYNPTQVFWCHNKLLDAATRDGQFEGTVQRFIVDHRHNPFLTPEEHEAYEKITDPETFRVYARGQTGKVSGTIFRMTAVEKVPTLQENGVDGKMIEKPMPFGFGIDLGYNSDRSAIVKVWYDKRDRYYKELLYKSENDILNEIIEKKLNMTPAQYMAKILKDNGCTGSTLVWGDHDKSYSIQLRRAGIPYRMARKGPNSLKTSIAAVKKCNNYLFESPNTAKEIETYIWQKAIDILTGKEITTTDPIDGMPDDLLACIRYFNYSYSMRFADNPANA